MTEAENMLEALGYESVRVSDYAVAAFYSYKKDYTMLTFSILKRSGEWKATVVFFDPKTDEYEVPGYFDVRLARAIVERLDELNNSEV